MAKMLYKKLKLSAALFLGLGLTGLEEAKGISLSVTAYPNPTTDHLTLSIIEFEIYRINCMI
jgi:hypothetical protein